MSSSSSAPISPWGASPDEPGPTPTPAPKPPTWGRAQHHVGRLRDAGPEAVRAWGQAVEVWLRVAVEIAVVLGLIVAGIFGLVVVIELARVAGSIRSGISTGVGRLSGNT